MTPRPLPASCSIKDIAEGARAQVDFTVSRGDMLAFAALSGDHNPLHLDEAFARARGFEGVVVYGALIAAKISGLIGMKLPGRDSVWCSLSLQFRAPLYVGEPARAEGVVSAVSEATGMVELAITAWKKEVLLARGNAEVLLVAR